MILCRVGRGHQGAARGCTRRILLVVLSLPLGATAPAALRGTLVRLSEANATTGAALGGGSELGGEAALRGRGALGGRAALGSGAAPGSALQAKDCIQDAASNVTPLESEATNGTGAAATAGQQGWVEGTWTTGYWDCCKPSCAWPGRGRVDRSIMACDVTTGAPITDGSVKSVCDGGRAASCSNNHPFLANEKLALGFAAAAVSGHHGLTGNENCGQCFELHFVDKEHNSRRFGDPAAVMGSWGGAHPGLVGKAMVVQVSNIGYDVSGAHSFDIQIPGAGQGLFSSGCAAQFAGFAAGDFDCDNRYGGCHVKDGCSRLPAALQPGCHWRYDWLHWLKDGGKTNNPWVKFRRVRCPYALTAVSGSTPNDDALFPVVDA